MLPIMRVAVLILTLISASSALGAESESSTAKSAPGQAIRAYITNFEGDGVSVIDTSQSQVIAQIRTGVKPHGVAIAPNGEAVYVSNESDGTLTVIDFIKPLS